MFDVAPDAPVIELEPDDPPPSGGESTAAPTSAAMPASAPPSSGATIDAGARSRPARIVAACVAAAVASAFVAGGIGFARNQAPARPTLADAPNAGMPTTAAPTPGAGSGPPGSAFGGAPGGSGAGSGGGSGNSGPALDTQTIVDRVTKSTVDITTSLGFGRGSAAGTGIVLTPDGTIVTNNHVVEGAFAISAQVGGTGKMYTAKVVGTDAAHDVAVVKLAGASGLTPAVTATASSVSIGDAVVAIGNALGRAGPPTAVTGTVRGLDQQITVADPSTGADVSMQGLIQTDAPLQPGDSGGPLVNDRGQVIGIDTAASGGRRFRSAGGSEGFAIPIETALATVSRIESGQGGDGIVLGNPAFLGVQVTDGPAAGAAVAQVESGTPAEQAGLAAGDTIVSFDGATVRAPDQLGPMIRAHKPGDRVKIGWVDASGQRHDATVRLTTGPAA